MMDKIIKAITSRTVWTVLVMVAINVVPVVGDYVNPVTLDLINAILGALAVYFRINTKVKF
jgi:hypothetical protein